MDLDLSNVNLRDIKAPHSVGLLSDENPLKRMKANSEERCGGDDALEPGLGQGTDQKKGFYLSFHSLLFVAVTDAFEEECRRRSRAVGTRPTMPLKWIPLSNTWRYDMGRFQESHHDAPPPFAPGASCIRWRGLRVLWHCNGYVYRTV